MGNLTNNADSVVLLSAVVATGEGDWFKLPVNKVFTVSGITTATVDIEFRTHGSDTASVAHSFTADGSQANSDALYEVRANVSAWTSGTITVTACGMI